LNTEEDINAFIENTKGKVLVAGYGSLLSQYSRLTYSQIAGNSIEVFVNGWERNWITRSVTEQQTYAGAIPVSDSALSAQLIALQFNQDFATREQDYRFTPINASCLEIVSPVAKHHHELQSHLANTPIYICETLAVMHSSANFPVSLSYIETCLIGCYELSGLQGVKDFFTHTRGWATTHFVDDRKQHLYPRSTTVEDAPWDLLALLDNASVTRF